MEKLKLHSPNLVEKNIEQIGALFPNCVTESKAKDGSITKAIDFDLLRQELSDAIVEGPQERYHLNWPGKREAMLAANAPVAKTLRPCREESVDFDTTKNLFIEGDNLDALKLLQETYLNKVKMIYIDPPYNTGNDLLYNDEFKDSTGEYLIKSDQLDSEGRTLNSNLESNGRFHSDWISMLYPRLKLARNLLKDDGICFISIGNHEIENLKNIANEIFGANNFISVVTRVMKTGGAKGHFFSPSVDFILAYCRDKNAAAPFRTKFSQEQIDNYYKFIQKDGERTGERYGEERIFKASLDPLRGCSNQRYWIECPDGSFVIPPGQNFPTEIGDGEKVTPTANDRVWKWTYERYKREKQTGNIVFKSSDRSPLVDEHGNQSKYNLYNKLWLKDQMEKGKVPSDYIDKFENRQSSAELNAINIPFGFAKPSNLISYLIGITRPAPDDIILDFFGGSGTTAHAVMKLNIEDQAHRRYIIVQLPEKCEESSGPFKAGFGSIAELAKERIRRSGSTLFKSAGSGEEQDFLLQGVSEITSNSTYIPDLGFRVLKVDTSNMKDVYYSPDAITQEDLFSHTDNIKEGRTSEDLLFQVLLDWGVDLSLSISKETLAGKTVFLVDENALAACFEADVSEAVVTEIAKRKPLRAVFRDSSFADDATKINVEQIFKTLSPSTEVRSI